MKSIKVLLWVIILLALPHLCLSATRDIVPRADNEGGLGTDAKRWANCRIVEIKGNQVIVQNGAGSYLQLPTLTTAQRDALSPVNGMMIYNSTTTNIERYEDSAWSAIAGGGSGDVESVGDCASGACLDGTSDGGTYVRIYDGDSNYTQVSPSNTSSNITVTLPSSTGTLLLTTGNASTASALAANGANCSAGNAPLGVDASGAVESCFDVVISTEIDTSSEISTLVTDETGSGALTFATNPSLVNPYVGNGATSAGGIRLYEDTDNGTNYTLIKSLDAQTSDITMVVGQTFTDTKWCSYATSTGLTCNQDAPAGSGDITIVGTCTTGDCAIEGGTDIFPFIYEGTADTYETTFQVINPTVDGVLTFPNETGTICTTGAVCSGYQGVLTNSAGLAGALNDETGTGLAVFATSPVFTTPNIGSATGSISGNAGTATALASNPTDCSANQFANAIAASGNLTCATVGVAGLSSADFGDFTCNGSACTTDNGSIGVADLASVDFGNFTCNGSACTLDNASITPAMLPQTGLTDEYCLTYEATGTTMEWQVCNSDTFSITYVLDGGGSAITTGVKGDLEIPFASTITGWTMLCDQTGSIVIDVWKDTYANYPPTVADTIAGSEKPTVSAATKGQDLSLSTWTTAITAGNTIRFNVDSASTVTRCTLSIKATRP